VISTVHLDLDTDNNARENLAALCQRCNDRHHQQTNRRNGRGIARKEQLKLV
jgi:5-methylcytosine-specific restriction endonuclease McrA